MRVRAGVLLLAGLMWGAIRGQAQSEWTQRMIFDNSVSPRSYFYSAGKTSDPSTLTLVDKKLPVETSAFVSGPNALKLEWLSAEHGGWDVEIRLPTWPNRYVDFGGDTLYVWVYSTTALRGEALPMIRLRDSGNAFSRALPLGEFAHELPAAKWTRVGIPMARFTSASVNPFQPRRTNTILLSQGTADGAAHVLLMDEIRIENAAMQKAGAPPVPTGLEAKGYEQHVALNWRPVGGDTLAEYVVYRSSGGGPFRVIGVQRPDLHRYVDFTHDSKMTAAYKVSARTSAMKESAMSNEATASTHPMSDDELLTMVEEASFQYY